MSDPTPPQPPQPPFTPQVIPYAQPSAARPSLITTAAVLSIVFGTLGILANVCSTSQSVMYLTLRSRTFAPIAVPTTASTTLPAAGAPIAPIAFPAPSFSSMAPAPFILAAIASLACLALAVYLLVAGILVLCNRPSARKHHLRYAILKFAVGAIDFVAAGWSMYELQRSIVSSLPVGSQPMPGNMASWAAVGYAAVMVLIGLVYPIAILILFNLSETKRYYATSPPLR